MSKLLSSFIVAGLIWVAASANAATVYCGTGQTYPTLDAAMYNYATGDNWGDGVDDTVIVRGTTTMCNSATNTNLFVPGGNDAVAPIGAATMLKAPDYKLTLRNDTGTSPTVMYGNAAGNRWVYLLPAAPSTHDQTIVIQGLTFFPNYGGVTGPGGNESGPFYLSWGATAGTHARNVTFESCIFTNNQRLYNLGLSDAPLLDLRTTGTVATARTFQGYILGNNAAYSGTTTMNAHNCTFAYASGTQAVFLRAPAPSSSVTYNIDHCLFARNFGSGVNVGAATNPAGVSMTLNLTESAFLNCGSNTALNFSSGIVVPDTPAAAIFTGANANISDTIFANNVANSTQSLVVLQGVDGTNANSYTGTLGLNRCTFYNTNSATTAVNAYGAAGKGTYTMTDCIFGGAGLAAAFDTFNTGNMPAGFTASQLAVVSGNSAYKATAASAIKSAFDNCYGSSGYLTADPQFVSVDFTSASFLNGALGWDRTSNTLFDVHNSIYAHKGTVGMRFLDALAGGADPTADIPVELSTFSAE